MSLFPFAKHYGRKLLALNTQKIFFAVFILIGFWDTNQSKDENETRLSVLTLTLGG
jgi:hypothetical protein